MADRKLTDLTPEEMCEWADRDPDGYYAAVDRRAACIVDEMARNLRRARRRRSWARVLPLFRRG